MRKMVLATAAAMVVVLGTAPAMAAGEDDPGGWFSGTTSPPAPPALPADDSTMAAPAASPSSAPSSASGSSSTTTTTTTTSTTTSSTTRTTIGAPKMADSVAAERAKPATSWYGWQTLLVDSVAISMIIGAVASAPDTGEAVKDTLLPHRVFSDSRTQTSPVFDAGLALFTVGPGIIHALHGRPGPAFGSAGVRALGPTAGVVAGAIYGAVAGICVSVATGGNNDAALGTLAVGIGTGYVAGFVVPVIVDASVWGHEPVDEGGAKAREKQRADASKATWRPSLGYAKGSPTVGLSGTF